jgi:class 3 adenylate cyclase
VSIPPVERKLAAIFAADIAGYRRLMAHDEVGTLARRSKPVASSSTG